MAGIYRIVLLDTPVQSTLYVLLFVLSQVTLLAMFLLPWKILVLFSPGVPSTGLEQLFGARDRHTVLLLLSALLAASFLLHFLADIGRRGLVGQGAGHILRAHGKTGLFNGHPQQMERIYNRLLSGISAAFCSLLVFGWLGARDQLLLLSVFFYLGLSAIFIRLRGDGLVWPLASRVGADVIERWWVGAGFLFFVGWTILGYIRDEHLDVSVVFISLVLSRQVLLLILLGSKQLAWLHGQARQVEALLFASTPWLPQTREADGFERLVSPEERAGWIGNLLNAHYAAAPAREDLDIRCRPVEGGMIVYITVVPSGKGDHPAFLLKLFHSSFESVARHEEELLTLENVLPCVPRLLGKHEIDGHIVFVLSFASGSKWASAGDRGPARMSALKANLLECSLPPALVARYDNSQPSLSRRLREIDWAVLNAFAPDPRVADLCMEIETAWPAILQRLDGMPRHLVLPGLERRVVAVTPTGDLILCSLIRWRWEPLGAGWPARGQTIEAWSAMIGTASVARPELAAVSPADTRLAAVAYEFERLVGARDFAAALELAEPLQASAGALMHPVGRQ
ncbi:hypothetical protein [Ciceribacter sp. RN22]|uniref:hypothetical protein n=1 Tax=Ciceribacter sp. RN22 TaxID=2954932 RepID=UPI0020939A43|nr:hypothetical protein [Ciceribacter sp. RN22]MCO6180976.1 hypothetical protein [Ciceribacter sp. RN22]